jgi:hypothetical protein
MLFDASLLVEEQEQSIAFGNRVEQRAILARIFQKGTRAKAG